MAVSQVLLTTTTMTDEGNKPELNNVDPVKADTKTPQQNPAPVTLSPTEEAKFKAYYDNKLRSAEGRARKKVEDEYNARAEAEKARLAKEKELAEADALQKVEMYKAELEKASTYKPLYEGLVQNQITEKKAMVADGINVEVMLEGLSLAKQLAILDNLPKRQVMNTPKPTKPMKEPESDLSKYFNRQ